MACKVATLDFLTQDILRLRLDIISGGPYTFSAGQFAKVVFAFSGGQARDYSMANRPDEADLEFHIRGVPGGISEKLPSHLKVGDAVKVSGPFGTSYLRSQHTGPILLVAGGSGLAPIRSILRTVLLAGGTSQPIHLYFGVRAERDVYGEAELRALQAQHRNLSVHIVLSEEQGNAPGRRYGLVSDAVRADFPSLQGFMAYLAGPPVMVEAATELAARLGIPARDVHADAFYATGELPIKAAAPA
jgi:naphthalene 1,2-dioxygenase ferredoxin reductase component